MGDVRIGVIGTGWWASQFHLPGLLDHPDAAVTALADRDGGRLAQAAEHFSVSATYRDHRMLLADGGVDGVVVAVPAAAHYEVARDALDAGVHVMLEKPMTLHARDAWDLVERAERGNLHLTVGYTYQHTRHARRVREAISRGEIGDLLCISGLFASAAQDFYSGNVGRYKQAYGWEFNGPVDETYSNPDVAGGGQGQTQVTHAMGMVMWATGARPAWVAATMDNHQLLVDLVDAISYRLDNGAVGTMASTGSLQIGQPEQQELRYYGTEGFIKQEIWAGALEIRYNDGSVEAPTDLGADERYPERATGRHLVDLISGAAAENLAPPRPAAAVVEFLESAYESAASGRPVERASRSPALSGGAVSD